MSETLARYFNESSIKNQTLTYDVALNKFCFLYDDDQVVFDYRLYKQLITPKTNLPQIIQHCVRIFNSVTPKKNIIHINLENISLTHVDKYYSTIREFTLALMEEFPDYVLDECHAYNASLMFSVLKVVAEKIYNDASLKNKIFFVPN
jgi:hypothetical protein